MIMGLIFSHQRGRRLAACAMALCLTACGHQPTALSRDPCQAPPSDQDWPVSTPAQAGFDGAALCGVLQRVANDKVNIHALLVERRGQLVTELYKAGPDRPLSTLYGLWYPFAPDVAFDSHTLHDLRSTSKSITALVFGIERDKGKAPDPGTPVLTTYPELGDLRDGQHELITVEHLLTMSSGLQWQEWGRSALSSDETALYWKQATARYLMDRPIASKPGSHFNYSGGNTQTLADILLKSTGQSVAELARQDLFEPMDIREWAWVEDIHDRPLAFAGLRLRPRDMLKFGRLVNDHGRWKGRQLVSATWIERSTQAHIQTGITLFSLDQSEAGYGYQWWTGHVRWRERDLAWTSTLGNGGQRIFVVPSLNLTIVMTAGDYGAADIHHAENDILSRIVAAVQP
jgi:CubicO group peptidase (beta-lactamase class C family)